MTADQRRAAERAMAQRDLRERSGRRGARAAARSRGPDFLSSDGLEEGDDMDGGLLSGMKRRTRRQYDERKDMDDMDGIDDVRLTVGSIKPLKSDIYLRNCLWSNLAISKPNPLWSGSSPSVSAARSSDISVISSSRTRTSMATLYMERGYETLVKVSNATLTCVRTF